MHTDLAETAGLSARLACGTARSSATVEDKPGERHSIGTHATHTPARTMIGPAFSLRHLRGYLALGSTEMATASV
jgi:hypothetical protein